MKRSSILLLTVAWLATTMAAAHTTPLPGDSLYQTPLVLRDQHGKRFSLLSLRGHSTIVSMFYASCTSICPLTIESIQRMRRAASVPGHAQLPVLLISFDPKHDSVARLASVARLHGLDSAGWRLGRPEQGDLEAFAATLGIAYRARDNGQISHNAMVALLDAEGRIVARTTDTGSPNPAFIEALRRLAQP